MLESFFFLNSPYYEKCTRFISLETDNDSNIRYIIRKLKELKEIITEQFVRSEVVFLEVPSLSIQHWNHSREHKNYKEFIEQDKKLELQLDQLNIKIRELNKSDNRSPRFMAPPEILLRILQTAL
jgi:hypothetical protein